MTEPDKRLDILHDHHKDTFSHIRDREKQRDRLFLFSIALLGFVVFQLQNTGITAAIGELSLGGAKLDLSKVPSHAILSTSWTFFLALLLRYCQVAVHIEKQYDYLHELERQLGVLLGSEDLYQREGKAYFVNKRHLFRNWTWFFYVVIFPLIVSAALVLSASLEIGSKVPVYHQWYDMLVAAAAFVSLALYLYRGKPTADPPTNSTSEQVDMQTSQVTNQE